MPRGGIRTNQGRKKNSGKWGCPTKAMRVPAHLEEQINRFIETIIPSATEEYTAIAVGYCTANGDRIPDRMGRYYLQVPKGLVETGGIQQKPLCDGEDMCNCTGECMR